ncbi:MAG: hypothetical protein M0Z85_09360 [Gammaproteobacteria bacterium]|nr:hypothetical protein [Gammaproteobacteria bacterium]
MLNIVHRAIGPKPTPRPPGVFAYHILDCGDAGQCRVSLVASTEDGRSHQHRLDCLIHREPLAAEGEPPVAVYAAEDGSLLRSTGPCPVTVEDLRACQMIGPFQVKIGVQGGVAFVEDCPFWSRVAIFDWDEDEADRSPLPVSWQDLAARADIPVKDTSPDAPSITGDRVVVSVLGGVADWWADPSFDVNIRDYDNDPDIDEDEDADTEDARPSHP